MSTSEFDGLMKKIHDEWPKASPGTLLSDSQIARVVAAARREGWAQAIEALRAEAERINPSGGSVVGVSNTTMWAVYVSAAAYLTDRAAALTEEGGQ